MAIAPHEQLYPRSSQLLSFNIDFIIEVLKGQLLGLPSGSFWARPPQAASPPLRAPPGPWDVGLGQSRPGAHAVFSSSSNSSRHPHWPFDLVMRHLFFLSHICHPPTPTRLILITRANNQCLAWGQSPGLQGGKVMAAVTVRWPAVNAAGGTPSRPSLPIPLLPTTPPSNSAFCLLPLVNTILTTSRAAALGKNKSVKTTIPDLSPLFTSIGPGLPGPPGSSVPAA